MVPIGGQTRKLTQHTEVKLLRRRTKGKGHSIEIIQHTQDTVNAYKQAACITYS